MSGRKRPSEECWPWCPQQSVVVVEFGGAVLENKAEGQRVESRRAVEVTAAHEVLDKFGGQ